MKSETGKRVVILGSTGSIGRNTLDVIAMHPDKFRVAALTAGRQGDLLVQQARRFHPEMVAVRDDKTAEHVACALQGEGIAVHAGESGLCEAAAHPDVDLVMSAIVGAAGLRPTMAAVKAGCRTIALANKECLVMAGALFMRAIDQHDVQLIPVDSEHSAVFQVLDHHHHRQRMVQKIILTASGGPFLHWDRERLTRVTPQQALAHPNWSMGRKISVDSATLMNKGLEVIEARWLFNHPPEEIDVVVHPESIVHALVTCVDGSVLAQLGVPDMCTPIAVALAWPERIQTAVTPLDLVQRGRLTFLAPDKERFPCLDLAYQALQTGDAALTVLNAANEIAVDAFLNRRLAFLEIPHLVETMLSYYTPKQPQTIEDVFVIDRLTREIARGKIR